MTAKLVLSLESYHDEGVDPDAVLGYGFAFCWSSSGVPSTTDRHAAPGGRIKGPRHFSVILLRAGGR